MDLLGKQVDKLAEDADTALKPIASNMEWLATVARMFVRAFVETIKKLQLPPDPS